MIYTIEEIQQIVVPIAKKHNIKAMFIFGSYARGTATENSDIDLIIDTEGTDIDSLFKLGSLYEEFAEALNKKVDIVTVSSLEQPIIRQSEKIFRETVLKERMKLYAAA